MQRDYKELLSLSDVHRWKLSLSVFICLKGLILRGQNYRLR